MNNKDHHFYLAKSLLLLFHLIIVIHNLVCLQMSEKEYFHPYSHYFLHLLYKDVKISNVQLLQKNK